MLSGLDFDATGSFVVVRYCLSNYLASNCCKHDMVLIHG